MPLYSFICNECGHGFETLADYAETPPCPSCGGAPERQLSLIAAPAKGQDHGYDDAPMCSGDGACGGMGCAGMRH